MVMDIRELIIKTLQNEVVPAIGCTEPVAVALACAKARELTEQEKIDKVEILVSPNIYKNGLGVGVPPTDEVGLHIAAALGIVAGNSSDGLQLLQGIGDDEIKKAKELLEKSKINLSIKDTNEKVYIGVDIQTTKGLTRAIIKEKHNQFVYIEQWGEVLLKVNESENASSKNKSDELYSMDIKTIIEAIENIPYESISFMLDGLTMNEKVAKLGLEKKVGMGVGYNLYENMKKGILADDFINQAKMLTAAASDARMSGISIPVMSSNGSGNNGLTAILPIAAYRSKFKVSDERLATALAMSHIINSYIKHYIGRLSSLCGCGVAAGTGAGVAITWLMGGNLEQVTGVIKNMIGDISGMVCDGAKVGCALKLSTSASSAIQASLLAINDQIIPSGNGIIGNTAEETIKNLRRLSDEGMHQADTVIINVMQNESKRKLA